MHVHSLTGANYTTDPAANRAKARAALARMRDMGQWPEYINGEGSLVERIPLEKETASGFDAGVACALDLIPADKQRLSCVLHAAYSEDAVRQLRREADLDDPNSETCWWLAMSSVCRESGVTHDEFCMQLSAAAALHDDPEERLHVARLQILGMVNSFKPVDGVPFVTEDGGLQGAYIAGYDWGVQYAASLGLFFIGTFRASLGLEGFPFSDKKDAQGRPMSGPVHGSKQFVKACSFQELAFALDRVHDHLGASKR